MAKMLTTSVSQIYTCYNLFSCCIIYIIVIFLSVDPVFLLMLIGVCLPGSDISFSVDNYNLSLVIVALPEGWWIGIGSNTTLNIINQEDFDLNYNLNSYLGELVAR